VCCGKTLCAPCAHDLNCAQALRIVQEATRLGVPLDSEERVLEFGLERQKCPLCQASTVDANQARSLQQHADLGKPWALGMLGMQHRDGTGGAKKDPKAAYGYFRRAAEKGSATAQDNLGDCYQHGWGTAVDMDEAAKCYERAASAGFALSQYKLGLILTGASGPSSVPADPDRAFALLSAAANQGYGPAQLAVGRAYEEGLGVPRSLEQSAFWTRKAAMQDDTEAQRNLAGRYLQIAGASHGGSANAVVPLALFWARKAAAAGDPLATESVRRMEASLGNKCARCGASAPTLSAPLLRCSRCKEARYCSVAHQKEHWTAHKRWCNEVKAAEEEYEQARKK
jgi:MYND finger/Sel1 repeat